MATATYEDYLARPRLPSAPQAAVETALADVAAEIEARCADSGTTYAALVESRRALVVRIECEAAGRLVPRPQVDGLAQDGLGSFSQTVGDHSWNFNYDGSVNKTLLRDELKALGLAGQKIGYLGEPAWGGSS